MVVQLTILRQLCNVIMSTWSKTLEEGFQQFVASMPERIRVVLKVNRGTSKV